MAIQQINDGNILTISHPDVVKRTNAAAMSVALLMLCLGILFFVLTFRLEDSSSNISMLLMVLGTGLLLYGVFSLFWRSKKTVYAPTGSRTKEHTLFFDSKELVVLTHMLLNGDYSNSQHLKSNPGGSVRMDIIKSEDGQFIAAQLFEFVPYNYVPATPVVYLNGQQGNDFNELFKHLK